MLASHVNSIKKARQEIETARQEIKKINKEEEPLKMAGRFLRHPIQELIALGTRYNKLCKLQGKICKQENKIYGSSDKIVNLLKVVYRCTSFEIDQNGTVFSTEQYDNNKSKIQTLKNESTQLEKKKQEQYSNIRDIIVPSVDKGIKYSLSACAIYAMLKGTYLL